MNVKRRPARWLIILAGVAAAAGAGVWVFLAVAGPHGPTVQTCADEIVAHPDESTWGPGCRGLSYDQRVQATIQAMTRGAHG